MLPTIPRWKGKGYSDIAQANPMSQIIKKLQDSLTQSKTTASLSGCAVLLEAGLELTDLLNRACFGQPISTCEEEKQWFQFGLDEAFYLSHALGCLTLLGEDGNHKTGEHLWDYMKFQLDGFPHLYKAYSHLRGKNYVVRPGLQYGADYVAYRHHPCLVHSEYAVLVLADGDMNAEQHKRLKTWSDWQCMLRVTGGVAKSLLLLSVRNADAATSLSSLEKLTVDEHTIARWVPEQSREVNASH